MNNRRAKSKYQKPVETVEVSGKNLALRLVFAIIFLLSGAFAIAVGVKNLVAKSSGWQEIEVGSSGAVNYSNEFILNYNLGTTGTAVNVESKKVQELYTQACVDSYQYFNADESGADYANLADLNASPNESFTVSDALYEALSQVVDSGSRSLYLGPIYASQTNLFSCETDGEAKGFDPYENAELATYYAQIAAFASDDEAIHFELSSDNQVSLFVSDDYLKFAEENGIDHYVDFSYLKNAFVCDYIADQFIEAGYINGVLTSYDGYSRYFDGGKYSSNYKIYGRDKTQYYEVATGSLTGISASMVYTDFSANDLADYVYYMYEDGSTRTRFVSAADGLDYAALPYLFCASEEDSCSRLALGSSPYYISQSWTEESVSALEELGIYTVYCKDDKVITNLPDSQETSEEETDTE